MPLFDDSAVHEVSLEMSPDDWQSIIDDSRGDEWRHAKLTLRRRRRGGGRRPALRRELALPGQPEDVDPDQVRRVRRARQFGGYRDVNVKGEYDDTSMMRERLALFVFGQLMPAPKRRTRS